MQENYSPKTIWLAEFCLLSDSDLAHMNPETLAILLTHILLRLGQIEDMFVFLGRLTTTRKVVLLTLRLSARDSHLNLRKTGLWIFSCADWQAMSNISNDVIRISVWSLHRIQVKTCVTRENMVWFPKNWRLQESAHVCDASWLTRWQKR